MFTVGMIVGAVLLLVGFVAGHITGRVAGRRLALRPPELVCSCGHGPGFHEELGRCHGEHKRAIQDDQGFWRGDTYVTCPCLSYDGPEPLPRSWTPPPPGAA